MAKIPPFGRRLILETRPVAQAFEPEIVWAWCPQGLRVRVGHRSSSARERSGNSPLRAPVGTIGNNLRLRARQA